MLQLMPRLPRALPRVPTANRNAANGNGGVISSGIAVIEDFRLPAPRLNGDGDALVGVYTGEDSANQVPTFPGDGTMVDTITTPASFYMDFRPREGGYINENSFIRNQVLEGTWDPTFNCLAFIMKLSISHARRSDKGQNVEMGTYAQDPAQTDPGESGRHFYHFLNGEFVANKWYKIWVDDKPQHEVGVTGTVPIQDPAYSPGGWHYWHSGLRFYVDAQPRDETWGSCVCYWSGLHMLKITGQNIAKVATVMAGYDGTKYDVSWCAPDSSGTYSYDVRYSANSMIVNGFSTGTDGGQVSSRDDAYRGVDWQSPSMSEMTSGIFIAIRPVGDTLFREIYLPYQVSPSNYSDDGF
jgi:hypothetical protein